jgi:serine/threonine protein kinase
MPEKFHQYNLIEILSKKYSHTTYLASPTNEPERQVILIVWTSSLFHVPRESENWLLDAQHIKQLQHPYIVPILDMGIDEGQPFVVREHLPHGSLRSRLKKISPHRLELKEVLTIISEVGLALTYAHEHNVIHGNIKPENILFNTNGHAMLTDFTLVDRKDAFMRDQTAEEYAFCYMAPEQFSGTCDARSDQYALGCLAYELIAGKVPFAAQSLATMMGFHSNAQPVPLSESVADVLPSLEAAVIKTLAKDPAERFVDCSLFLEIVCSVLSPTPLFPIVRSAHSRKNRTNAHSAQVAEAERRVSPIRKRAARKPPEQFAVSSEEKAERREPVDTLSASDASILEGAGMIPPSGSLASHLHSNQFTSPLSGETYLVDKGANEQEIPPLLLTDPFVEEEADAFPAMVPLSVDYERNEYATAEMALTVTDETGGAYTLHPRQRLRRRRKILVRAVLLLAIIALIAYFFFPGGMTLLKPSLGIADKKQVVAPRSTNISTLLVSRQVVTPVATVQSPVTATLVATQPPVLVTPIPISQTQTPTPSPPTSYEAEAPQNTLAGGTSIQPENCSDCSGGARVGYIGKGGTLQFNDVSKNMNGSYTLTIYYMLSGQDTSTGYLSVNGGPATTFNVPSTATKGKVETMSIGIRLKMGNNTILFSNPSAYAPDIDRIVV